MELLIWINPYLKIPFIISWYLVKTHVKTKKYNAKKRLPAWEKQMSFMESYFLYLKEYANRSGPVVRLDNTGHFFNVFFGWVQNRQPGKETTWLKTTCRKDMYA